MEPESHAFIVLVFPTERDAALRALFKRLHDALGKASATAPVIVWPNVTALAILVEGELQRITRALEEARAMDTRYLVVRADAPFATCGLSTAQAWLKARAGN